jgi:hypothetical protein
MASKNEVSEPIGHPYDAENHTSNGSPPIEDYKEPTDVTDGNRTVLAAIDDVAALPKGTVDPVYEAKARVLNKAVGTLSFSKPHD